MISYTIAYFRPEDGLRCRQGVKPALELERHDFFLPKNRWHTYKLLYPL